MIKVMQTVFPLVTQIQLEVIQNYGFTGDGDGECEFRSRLAYTQDMSD